MNFLKIASGMDVLPLLHAVYAQPELWNRYTVRTAPEHSAHRQVDDILLRYNAFARGDDFLDKVCAELQVVNYPAWAALPQVRPFVFGLMTRVDGVHLGRVMITKLRPGLSIPPHSDLVPPAIEKFPHRIHPAEYYNRYHVVLQSQPGVVFNCDGESVYMAPGELWWFNNKLVHDVVNNSAEDRIHLIIDIRTRSDDYIPD